MKSLRFKFRKKKNSNKVREMYPPFVHQEMLGYSETIEVFAGFAQAELFYIEQLVT